MAPSVIKRNGQRESIRFDEILRRLEEHKGTLHVDVVRVAKTVVQGVRDGITTRELDELAVETATSLSAYHPDYSLLAARVAMSDLHKKTQPSMRVVVPFLASDVESFVTRNLATIDDRLKFERDFSYDIFGYRTLEKAYLLRDDNGEVIERPQVMLMRNALGIHTPADVSDDEAALERSFETYEYTSNGRFTHATPTMFNAGLRRPNMASCFLLPVADDSIDGIFDTLHKCAAISKSAGGVGLSFSNVRASGSRIGDTGGKSAGLVPFLRIYDATARAVDQGGGKRKGAFAIYLEPWHKDVEAFLDLKKNHGAEEMRARDLFYAMWIPDLFMRRVEAGEDWTLLCPSECPDLVDLHGGDFERAYEAYEHDEGKQRQRVRARDVWNSIVDAQIETGTPYMLYKDSVNRKSNHSHLGTIRCSNLCTEIMQFSSATEVAVCNLGSLALPAYVRDGSFDHAAFAEATRVLTRNLNRVIDRNAYPLPEAEASNMKHRPIGLGVQGLADAFVMLGEPFDGPQARVLNREIFETLYYAALDASCALAESLGSYASYEGSPASKGILQFDMWPDFDPSLSDRWDWEGLRARIAEHGLRNSLLVAPMPTASTAQILGNTECFEPRTSNLYVRRVQAGEFAVFNPQLVRALEDLDLWNEDLRTHIVASGGSVQSADVPDRVKDLFKTAWEISQRVLIDMAADRGVFVDQSQSLNLFIAEPDHAKITSMHFYAWRKGLKTGMYYLRTKPAANALQVTVPVEVIEACSLKEGCISCSA